MGLATKARPKKFKDVFGNEETIEALKVLFKQPVVNAHAFLLIGPTGCGKTTLARIIASKLGAKNKLDVSEYNAANTRGIDTIREIADQSKIMPMSGKARVFILDECAQLTSTAQEALLKALEDPPKTAYFVLCTTQPHRVIATIKGRCNIYRVEPIDDRSVMMKLLKTVHKKHKLEKVSDEIYEEIIEQSEGCPRKALTLLDQCQALDTDTATKIAEGGGTADVKEAIDLCRIIVDGKLGKRMKWKKCIEVYKKMIEIDPVRINQSIQGYLASCIKGGDYKRAGYFCELIECFGDSDWNLNKAGLLSQIYLACGVE